MCCPLFYLLYSLQAKARWRVPTRGVRPGLEWEMSSPPPTENFAVTPRVTSEPYEFEPQHRGDGDEACLTRSFTRHARRTATRHAAHHPALQHHFETMAQQKEAAVLGMWAFLLTEILFFGGLFMAYMLYRIWYHDAFVAASRRSITCAGAPSTPSS